MFNDCIFPAEKAEDAKKETKKITISGTEYQVNDEAAETGVSVGDDNWMPIYFFNYND